MITFKFIINSRLGAYLKFIIYEYQTFCVYDIEVFPLFSVRLQSLDHVIVNGREVRGGGAMRLTGCSSIYRHFGLFTDSLVKTCLSVVFSAREIAKRDAEKDELMTALSRSCEELTSLRTQVSMIMKHWLLSNHIH